MEFDLLASIELTASCAIAIAVLASGLGDNVVARVRIAAGLTAWFVLVVLLAASAALDYQHGLGVPGLGAVVALPILILAVHVLRVPALRQALQTIPLSTLIGVNTIRIFGGVFLLLHLSGRLPAPFAPVAGWGDVLTGLSAMPVAWLAYQKGESAHVPVIIWNSLGLIDLIAAVALGVVSSPGPLRVIFAQPGAGIMTALPWLLIPGFLVPLLASTHLAVFFRLGTGGAPLFPRKRATAI